MQKLQVRKNIFSIVFSMLLFFFLKNIYIEEHRRFIRKVFTWPKEMEKILDITMQRITLQRQVMENSLSARRIALEEMFVSIKYL